MLSKSIGTNIKQFRTQKGLSQDSLAEKLFVTRQTISNYETGKSYPDIDTLQKIAAELDVELTWLLYGKPVSPRKKASFKTTVIVAVIFAVMAVLTYILHSYTYDLRLNDLIVMPNIVIRLILVPFCYVLLGSVLLQILDCVLGIIKPKNAAQKVGRIITLCSLGVNLIVVLPYICWCMYILCQIIIGRGNISAYFPSIPVYEDVAMAFLALMYKAPYVYAFVGIALWLFYPPQRDRLNNK